MTYETKPNTGTLWKNDRKEKDTHPDYRGSINVDGHEYEISAWIKSKKDGGKFMSLAIKEPYQKSGGGSAKGSSGGYDDLMDEVPF